MQGFLTISYDNDAYFALQAPVFIQTALSILVKLFERVGFNTDCLKTQGMNCTPSRIWTRLPTASYHCMRLGYQTSEEWEAGHMICSHCNTTLQAHSLPHHLATLHGVYKQTVVAEELLDKRASMTFKATQHFGSQLQCPVTRCLGIAKDWWNMQHHFHDLHPWDKVIVPKEGQSYP
jgi:hypothetical protein